MLLARLCSVDRLSFNTLATSEDICSAFKAKGHDFPRNHKTVKQKVWQHYDSVKAEAKEKIAKIVASGGRFSISVDEYTSKKNRRYMVLNLHDGTSVVTCLGLIRVHGSMPAEKAAEKTRKRLLEFGLNVQDHIFGVVSDGARIMLKYARLLGIEHQICHSHGLHLAVCDVIYKSSLDGGKFELRENGITDLHLL